MTIIDIIERHEAQSRTDMRKARDLVKAVDDQLTEEGVSEVRERLIQQHPELDEFYISSAVAEWLNRRLDNLQAR